MSLYIKLKIAKKSELIAFLIPLIELSVKINECWIEGRNGEHPTDNSFDARDAELSIWPKLRDLHDDFGQIEKIL